MSRVCSHLLRSNKAMSWCFRDNRPPSAKRTGNERGAKTAPRLSKAIFMQHTHRIQRFSPGKGERGRGDGLQQIQARQVIPMRGLTNWWPAEAPSPAPVPTLSLVRLAVPTNMKRNRPLLPCRHKQQWRIPFQPSQLRSPQHMQPQICEHLLIRFQSPCIFPTVASYQATSLVLLRRSSSSPSPTTSECYEKGQPLYSQMHSASTRFHCTHP
jgi:hypothetical protein